VVSHTCLDQIRAQTKWQWADLDTLDQEDGRAAGPVHPVVDDPVERDLLLRVLDRSSQECRELWRMLVLGLSYREMSLRLQVAEGTLRVRVLRCRERAVAARAELLGPKSAPARNKVVARAPKKGGEATTP
jgi:DNA-directed RNA polymerase specialized sigma24 family protein